MVKSSAVVVAVRMNVEIHFSFSELCLLFWYITCNLNHFDIRRHGTVDDFSGFVDGKLLALAMFLEA